MPTPAPEAAALLAAGLTVAPLPLGALRRAGEVLREGEVWLAPEGVPGEAQLPSRAEAS